MKTVATMITGTRKGIGRYLAEYYLGLGHTVFGCSRSSSDLNHHHYHHYEGDVANERFIKTIFADINKQVGYLNHLINNAGIASMNHSMLMPTKKVTEIMNTNFTGTFVVSREASKLLRKSSFGRIVNFSTVAVPLSISGEAVYAASKAAVVALTKILAKELAAMNITVNAVGPTPVETDLIRSVPEDKIQNLLAQQAIRRFGQPDDISNVIDFFFHEKSQFITGQTIYLGGVS